MPDFSVVTTVISTTGALVGALGVVAVTHRANARREETQFRREETQFNRQWKEQRTEARRQVYADLLGAANQLKVEVEIAGQRHWRDMNVRLATIQQHAVSAGLHASRVALLSPETAEAALSLASAARLLTAAVAKRTNLGYQGEQFLGGEITHPADFAEFDECIKRFSDAAAQDLRT
ncbi:MAG TPA: hypothetical protein VJT72_11485 [Pseudonocardiaceae bacterium]|nr:hypothetical protein [Pseudonocardiaceae bacterium]